MNFVDLDMTLSDKWHEQQQQIWMIPLLPYQTRHVAFLLCTSFIIPFGAGKVIWVGHPWSTLKFRASIQDVKLSSSSAAAKSAWSSKLYGRPLPGYLLS
ncbi:hypothetical protein TNCV_4442031 [Trichonephila clavipes]|nr:hypothetical protein TNCV_4442031 [Trichonephila clavipes]